MATVKAVVLKHHKKADGTWNVKIRVTHGKQSAYINTHHFVTLRQIKQKGFEIKDDFVLDAISPVLTGYRQRITSLGLRIERMTAKQIAEELIKPTQQQGVDFKEFCQTYIAELKEGGKTGSAANMTTAFNAICDFFEDGKIAAEDINYQFLKAFEQFLRKPRTIYRDNQFGKIVKIKCKGVGDSGLFNYMRDLRVMFNAARDKHNDEDNGIYRIPHYPFKKYKLKEPAPPEKRSLNVEQIKEIRDSKVKPGSRAQLGRDLYMLSFYLCGINAADMYKLPSKIGDRINYNRSKTKDRRKDKAYISIAVPEIARPLLKKYAGKLQKRFSCVKNLNKAISIGLRGLEVGELEFYSARHSFATLARNECGFSKDDIALALNHIDRARKTTDVYLAPDWSIIDRAQEAVISLLFPKDDQSSPEGSALVVPIKRYG